MNRAYVSNQRAYEVACDTLTLYEVGNLHSQSSTRQVARCVQRILTDEGLNTRWSLCLMIAKQAQVMWLGQVRRTSMALRGDA